PASLVAPVELLQKKRSEAAHLLNKGGVIVCLLHTPEGWGILGPYANSYDWIPVPNLGDLVKSSEGVRIRIVKENPFDEYMSLEGVTWKAYLEEPTSVVRYETLATNEANYAVGARITQ